MTQTITAMQNNDRVLGIVAEYNPLHTGHVYQMRECQAMSDADYTVIIMSGDFTQRGEPALIDKWSRTKTALGAGADLVVELPFYYACNGAGYFAKGAVKILDAIGVTHIGFGSESGDINELIKASEGTYDETPQVKEKMKEYLAMGMSYPKAAEKAFGYDGRVAYEPNNILAMEYIKALRGISSNIKPVTVKRKGAGYGDQELSDSVVSAKAVRKNISGILEDIREGRKVKSLPETTVNVLKEEQKHIVCENSSIYFDLLRAVIMRTGAEELAEIFSVSEGLENKMKNEIRYAKDLNDYIERLKSKRYTRTRIQRICVHTLTGFKKNAVVPEYIRILGFTKKGAGLIRKIKERDRAGMPVITNINRETAPGIESDITASDIYNLICKKDLYKYSEHVKMLEIFG